MPAEPRIVFEDAQGRRRLPLGDDLTVGRARESGLRLEGREVSRHHARFVCAGGAAFIEDMGSRNGTFVNCERIRGRCRLRGGDVVRVGDELLRYEERELTEDVPAAMPPPLPGRATLPPLSPAMLGRGARAENGERTAAADLAPRPSGLCRALAAALRALRR